MKVLNLYYSATGNTEKVATQIENAVLKAGHDVETIRVLKAVDLDLLAYRFCFCRIWSLCLASPESQCWSSWRNSGRNTPRQRK